jgi:hypothetical protein
LGTFSTQTYMYRELMYLDFFIKSLMICQKIILLNLYHLARYIELNFGCYFRFLLFFQNFLMTLHVRIINCGVPRNTFNDSCAAF